MKAPLSTVRVATSWEEVDESIWLESTWGERGPTLLEQSVRQKEGFQITLLFIDSAGAEEDEEHAELEEDYALHFRRK